MDGWIDCRNSASCSDLVVNSGNDGQKGDDDNSWYNSECPPTDSAFSMDILHWPCRDHADNVYHMADHQIEPTLHFVALEYPSSAAAAIGCTGDSTIALAAEIGWSIYGIHNAWNTYQKANRGGVCTCIGWVSGLLLVGV